MRNILKKNNDISCSHSVTMIGLFYNEKIALWITKAINSNYEESFIVWSTNRLDLFTGEINRLKEWDKKNIAMIAIHGYEREREGWSI